MVALLIFLSIGPPLGSLNYHFVYLLNQLSTLLKMFLILILKLSE